jgi:hydroxymethylpyrimidine pyrophosphatase-like HAD family hydrolase
MRRAGVHLAICTGRNSVESAGVIGALVLTGPGVFVNGAMVADVATGKTVRARIVEDVLAREAVDFFGSMGHAVLGLADDAATRMPAYFMTDHAPPHRSTTEWLLANRMHARVCEEIPAEHLGRLVRLGIVVDVPEGRQIERALEATFGGRAASHSIYSPYYDCQVIELFAAGTSKWAGIEEVARELRVRADQVIAIGDDTNDVAMLEGARLSFAMGNARPEIQKLAKRVTGKQTECGVAAVIENLLAGRLEPAQT